MILEISAPSISFECPPVSWFPAEQAALTLPAGLTVSEWAAAHREFPKDASFPGRWDPHKAPYAIEPMDAYNDPRVERITLVASARSVKTEIWLNMLGYSISQDAAPALVVMPTENKVKRICGRITKMIKASSDLRQFLTGNKDHLQKKSIILRHMETIFATAGSAADLGEFEARNVFESETDTYPPTVGDQGAPTQMAEMRARTFWNRKIVTESKPIREEGFIFQDYLRSDQRKFLVPCPHCGGYQVLDFWRVKHRGEPLGEWPKNRRDPDYIKAALVAVYECCFCQKEIEEHHKPEMLVQGVWTALPAQLGAAFWEFEIPPDSRKPEPPPANTHQGYWWNALYSPFATWSEIAAKYFEVKDDREQYRTFVNEWLGFPFKEMIRTRGVSSLIAGENSLCASRPELEVPDNVVALTLGADNHKRGLAVCLWAWERVAPRIYNQYLIRYGWLADFQELEAWLFQDVYYNREGNLVYRVWRAALDTGGGEGYTGDASLTEQAYEFIRTRGQGRVWGIKGASKRFSGGNRLHLAPPLEKMPSGKPLPGGLRILFLDTNALKDAFWARVEAGRVFFHGATGEDFARQLAAEAREWDQKKREWLWKQQGGRANHYLDATIYAGAMADTELYSGLDVLPLPEPERQAAPAREINPMTGKPRGSFWSKKP
jgi:phage terminase large subunit GpA-like protein